MKHNELLLLLCKKTTNLQCLCEAQKVRIVIESFLLFCFVNWTLIGKTPLDNRKSLFILKRRNKKLNLLKMTCTLLRYLEKIESTDAL